MSAGSNTECCARSAKEKMPVYYPLETVVRAVPLGLRCLDIATRAQVSDGLLITATPPARAARPAPAFLTLSGVYAFRDLPGLRDFEYGDAEAPTPASPPTASPDDGFAIRVEDAEGRYLPYAMTLTLPRRKALTTFLFSAPGRAGVPGLMTIRGGLRDSTRTLPDGSKRPASFARVVAEYEATNPPTIYAGLADWRGEFAIFLPAPNPLKPPPGDPVTSPNAAGRKTFAELRWPVTLSFFYEPQAQEFVTWEQDGRFQIVAGQTEGLTDIAPERSPARYVPLLRSLLNQAAAEVLPATPGGASASLQAEVEFGKDLVVQTGGAADSSVWLVPAPVQSP